MKHRCSFAWGACPCRRKLLCGTVRSTPDDSWCEIVPSHRGVRRAWGMRGVGLLLVQSDGRSHKMKQ
ncbi:MAG: hypothetical protein Q4D38_09895 [Planctomycetia bacterium]|nr:hypothetical protein [Planctomycetia bacterium]